MGIFSSPNSLQKVLSAPGVEGKSVTKLTKGGLTEFIQSIIVKTQEMKESFYILDLGVVMSLYENWTQNLPMIQPFYAFKCNPEPALLGTLAALGSNFDCASKGEIEAILALGVSPDRILFANPCKAESHIKYAARVGVNLTTFDSRDELDKMQVWHPKCKLLIRIKPPLECKDVRELSTKFGALNEEVLPLLRSAKGLGLNVVGVTFHIGSAAKDSRAYREAIAAAKAIFDTAILLGMPKMYVVDVGGGFTADSYFNEMATVIKAALQDYFPNEPGLSVISEPGRYFAETSSTLVTNIIGKRVRGELREYWINDGTYGSFNGIPRDNIRPTITCTPIACTSNPSNPTCKELCTYKATVFGPTCDSLDTILKGHQLPELHVNDWLVFHEMGAYTAAGGSNFNGFDMASTSTYLAF
ncbi:hypothetical protein Ddye_007344 [Dipteronia dyeriana]|uniref:ornithine decarboxylase n=1 Tax=Dipteronia dyeriana TaxID=168575 RepID=A0AAD9XJN2_9ROSI|nr:hypothetical protein Ddye_007344 [Dipteronia dyeriana]